MTFMDLMDEYIDLKMQGEPASSDWRSIDEDARRRGAYRDRLASLRNELDALAGQPDTKKGGAA